MTLPFPIKSGYEWLTRIGSLKIKLFVAVFIAMGCLFTLIGVSFCLYNAWFVSTAYRTVGQIVDVDASKGTDGTTYFYPVFQYRDAQGALHKIHSPTGLNPSEYQSGDSVPVA